MWLSQPWLSQLCLSISPEDQTELHQSVALMGVCAVGGKDLPLDIQGGPIFLCNRERPEGEKLRRMNVAILRKKIHQITMYHDGLGQCCLETLNPGF